MKKKERVEEEENKKVKKYFENRYLSKRIDFIEDYDFENDKINYLYFKNFILNFQITNNNWYNSLIIDLSDRLNIYSLELYDKYNTYLKCQINYIFKLSILDYFANQFLFYKHWVKEEDLKIVLIQKHERLIVKNQILINAIIFFTLKKIYIELLISNLYKTNDYRSHIRIYNYIMNFCLENKIGIKNIEHMLNISRDKKLGKAVNSKIIEFEKYLYK